MPSVICFYCETRKTKNVNSNCKIVCGFEVYSPVLDFIVIGLYTVNIP